MSMIEPIKEVFTVDFQTVFISAFMLLAAIVAGATLIGKFSEIIGKPVRWIKRRKEDHELLIKTVESLNSLKDKHNIDIKNTTQQEEKILTEINKLTEAVNGMSKRGEKRDRQIDSLMLGTMELLGNTIDEKFSKYVEMNGIPENEVDEFDGLYEAYAATGGNSTRKHKYEYVKANLKVIPVEVKIHID